MKIFSPNFDDGGPIPAEFAFAKTDPEEHAISSDNRNPALSWSDLPRGCRSLVLICVDPDAPSVVDDVNQEERTLAAELPRADFHHWVMVDIPPTCSGVEAGECSDGVTPGGKQDPPGPTGARQGVQDFTGWFASDADMAGTYRGYDGPAPPWNDERLHHYHFRLFALDVVRCPVDGDFEVADVERVMAAHLLATAEWVGTYTLNPALQPT